MRVQDGTCGAVSRRFEDPAIYTSTAKKYIDVAHVQTLPIMVLGPCRVSRPHGGTLGLSGVLRRGVGGAGVGVLFLFPLSFSLRVQCRVGEAPLLSMATADRRCGSLTTEGVSARSGVASTSGWTSAFRSIKTRASAYKHVYLVFALTAYHRSRGPKLTLEYVIT